MKLTPRRWSSSIFFGWVVGTFLPAQKEVRFMRLRRLLLLSFLCQKIASLVCFLGHTKRFLCRPSLLFTTGDEKKAHTMDKKRRAEDFCIPPPPLRSTLVVVSWVTQDSESDQLFLCGPDQVEEGKRDLPCN